MKKSRAFNIAISSGKFNHEKDFWQKKLAGELTSVHFPYDNKFPEEQGESLETVSFKIPEQIASKLLNLSNNSHKRLLIALIAGVKALLYRYTGETDLLILTPVEKQKERQEYLNTALILRDQLSDDMNYKSLLLTVKDTLVEAEKFQNYPYTLLCEMVDTYTKDLFHVGVLLKNIQDISYLDDAYCEIIFTFEQINETLTGCVVYDPNLYHNATIQQLITHYLRFFEQVMLNIELKLHEVNLLSVIDKEQILIQFNATQKEYPDNLLLQQMFEEEAAKHPAQIAIEGFAEKITYQELNQLANLVAEVLREERVTPDQIIGIMVQPSVAMVSGILGVLKTGGAYLPIDPTYPKERIAFYLEDSKTKILLCQSHLSETIPSEYAGKVIYLDKILSTGNVSMLECPATSANLAYVIYTSGSTGHPKGVMIEHHNVVNLTRYHRELMQLTSLDRVAFFPSFSFDASVLNIFSVLTSGAILVLIPLKVRQDPTRVAHWFKENKISVAILPTRMGELISKEKLTLPLRLMLVGGEKLNHIPQVNYPVINEYGPTENTITSTTYVIKQNDSYPMPPIGKPITNVEIYILDAHMKPVPIHVVGEIYLAGSGVARGYLNRPELTAERFLPNPFKPNSRMYKTGDLGRWLSDGNIEFIGRIDSQVKIRGFRIEIEEIEANLKNHPDIREVAALLRKESEGELYLTAYIATNRSLKIQEIREYLQNNLPSYMIPEAYAFIDELSETEQGKIDKKALLKLPVKKTDESNYVPPTTELEKTLCDIWQTALHVEAISIEDNFFELGGHSLKAANLITQIHHHYQIDLGFKDIFEAPTIRELATRIANGKQSTIHMIQPQPESESYPVASAQKRIFILRKFEGDQISYNTPGGMIIEGSLNRERFKTTIQALIARHDSLRTQFIMKDNEILQVVLKEVPLDIEYGNAEENAIKELFQRFIRPFDLEKAPLLRIGLYHLTNNRHLFLIDMHHIISDGVSMTILQREFIELYNGQELEPLRIQYKDYAIWQNNLTQSGELAKQEKFWLEEFAGEIPVLNLPTDFQRPTTKTYTGSVVEFAIREDFKESLNKLARKEGSTLFIVMLALYAILLAKYSGQEEIIIGSPADGRPTEDLQKLIGMFVNTLPFRLKPMGHLTFNQFLLNVKNQFFNVMENQDYQFDMLIEKLHLSRDHSRNPLFDTMLTMQNWDIPTLGLQANELIFKPLSLESNVVKMDLVLNICEEPEKLNCGIEYNSSLFTRETIERMKEHFCNLIGEVLANTEEKLSNYSFTSDTERHQLLYEFNQPLVEYQDNKTVITQYLEIHAATRPDAIAIYFNEEKVTYKQLNTRINQLARKLRDKGVKPETIVAIITERSVEMLIGLLAIFKVGGAYLPIDPRYPKGRISYTIADSRATLILTQQKYADIVPSIKKDITEDIAAKIETIYLDDAELYTGDSTNLTVINQLTNLAYIIYTSGSTGKPKGVMIEHNNLLTALKRHHLQYPIAPAWTYLYYTSYTFDASIYELFGWIISGAKVYILQPGKEKDPVHILQMIKRYNITHAHFVPSMLSILVNDIADSELQALNTLHYIYVGGEILSQEIVNKFFSKIQQVKIYNVYGPTETTIDATDFLLTPVHSYKSVPIGKPMQNVHVYILDSEQHLQPIGVPGEMFIGGLGVGRGYLNRPELTTEKFIMNPYIPTERIYRSGDLARWLPDGNIEFIGRIDQQVKVRGFRIELGEIENLLKSHDLIKDAIVVSKKNAQDDNYLCAYLITKEDISVKDLQNYLQSFLPEYMVPAYFITLDSFPLLSSGKIDRHSLPNPNGIVHTGVEYVAPSSELEISLAKIWQEILSLERVGVHDSFFQLGGTSLSIIRLFERVKEITDVPITVANLFSYHTIAMFAEYLRTQQSPEDSYENLLAQLANDELSPEEAAQLFIQEER